MSQNLSIAIPVYEAHGKGWLYLSELLNSIKKQTFQDYEVVISDQSIDDNIKKLCDLYSDHMNIKYVSGHSVNRTNSCNANNAIANCSSDFIKIMFGDDFFIDDRALEKIKKMFDSGSRWIVNGSVHCNSIHHLFRPLVPYYNHDIHKGINTISSPSVLAFYKKIYFDEKLIMLMDCDIYKNLYNTYGNPTILKDFLICNRLHENQMQNLHKDKLEQEIVYCTNKYN